MTGSALAFLHMEQRIFPPDYESYLAAQNPQLYQPVGILYLVSPDAPDPAFCMACKVALRVSACTSPACSSVISVITVPAAPARAVRPERCRYALCSTGGSASTRAAP